MARGSMSVRGVKKYRKKILRILTYSPRGGTVHQHGELFDDAEKRLRLLYYTAEAQNRDGYRDSLELIPLQRAICEVIRCESNDLLLAIPLVTFLARNRIEFFGLDDAMERLRSAAEMATIDAQHRLDMIKNVIKYFEDETVKTVAPEVSHANAQAEKT